MFSPADLLPLCLLVPALAARLTPSGAAGHVERRAFGATPGGEAVDAYTLTNARGVQAEVITYGGILRTLQVPDRDGRLADVVLGHDDLAGYLALETSPYFGALIGRYGNRIGGAAFTLDGTRHVLPANDGANTLHGGPGGFHTVVWKAEPFTAAGAVGVRLRHTSPDGDAGFPGALDVRVTYTLTDAGALAIDYEARADRATPVNLTHHSYFNLAGAGQGDVLGHVLTLNAARFTPVDASLIPTGRLQSVVRTPFDFTLPAPVGARIGWDDPQLHHAGGYDHNLVIDGPAGTLRPAARVEEPASGRVMTVATTEPGVQFYSGNFLDGSITGKDGRVYAHRGGFCLETQHFPDAPNQPGFPPTILRPGATYTSRTVYAFGTRP